MISVLLETERLDSPHGGLARAPTDVGALVRECVDARHDEDPGVELEAGATPVVADLDAARMKLVVGNLLTNAIRHSSPAGPPVRVEVRKNGTGIRLEIHDRGVGIPEEDLPHALHSPHGSAVTPVSQFRHFARMRASVVLPTPRVPVKR